MKSDKKELYSRQYFFWNDKPYKVIRQSKRQNIMEALDLENNKRVMLPWAHWKRHHERAYLTSKVAEILERHNIRVRLWLTHEKIPRPYSLAEMDGIERDFGSTRVNYLWKEKDILQARDYMESTGRECLSRSQVLAKLNSDRLVQYVQDDNGEFVPIWNAAE
jgi:hypothetical protein